MPGLSIIAGSLPVIVGILSVITGKLVRINQMFLILIIAQSTAQRVVKASGLSLNETYKAFELFEYLIIQGKRIIKAWIRRYII